MPRRLLQVAGAERLRGSVDQLKTRIERAIDLARGAGRRTQVIAAYSWAMYILTCVSASDGIELVAGITSRAEEVGDRDIAEGAWWHLGHGRLWLGDFAGALDAAERSLSLTQESGHGGRMPESEQLLALCLLATSDLAGAEQHALRGVEIVAADDTASVASTHSALGQVRAAQGRVAEAEQLLTEGVEIIQGTYYAGLCWEYQSALADFLLRQGRTDEAERWLTAARESAGLYAPNRPALAWIERDAAAARAAGERANQRGAPSGGEESAV